MKLNKKILMCAAAMSCLAAVPAMAAENNKSEIKSEIADTRQELKAVNSKIKELNAENKTLSAQFKTMKTERKTGGNDYISKEDWKKVKELAADVSGCRKELKETHGKAAALCKEAKVSIKAKDFESGADSLEEALKYRQGRLELIEEINGLLEDITAVH